MTHQQGKRSPFAQWVMYPFLFAIYPNLFLFSHNIAELSILEQSVNVRLALPLTLSVLATGTIWGTLTLLLKNRHKAGILTMLPLGMFFVYGQFNSLYSAVVVEHFGVDVLFTVKGIPFARNKLYVVLWMLVCVVAGYGVWRSQARFIRATQFFNIMAGILVLIPLGQIGIYEFKRSFYGFKHETLTVNMETSPTSLQKDELPDIYYIVLDEYAAASTLLDEFQYNNQEFLTYLTEKGFYIAPHSLSNYVFTVLSLASSLNMEYLNYLREQLGENSKDLDIPISMVKNSAVKRFVQSKGYTYIQFQSGYPPTLSNELADVDVNCEMGLIKDPFVKLFVSITLLDMFWTFHDRSHDSLGFKAHRDRILCQFSTLSQLHHIDAPLFVFAHIIAPHFPYVFGADGEEVSDVEVDATRGPERCFTPEGKYRYIEQLQFVNTRVKTLVDTILANSSPPPIIIIQGDHGTRIHPWEENLKASMRIFNAYYVPYREEHAHLYASISPVNTFRVLFNQVFGTTYKTLPDRSYYSDYWGARYNLVDVTDAVAY